MGGTDRDAEFVEYYAVRAPALRRLAFGLCGDWHTADDLVQTTCIRLYRGWGRIRAETIDAYARRALVNQFLSQRRRWRESVTADPPDTAHPTDDIDRVPERMALHQALAMLGPRQRAAVVLRYLEDLPVADVATLLGVSEGTVKSQTARAVQALRAALNGTTLITNVERKGRP
ncbi:SigE family RNA polymerase sigma factor [Dactylosporangium sp. AC04546]|uniref:SigE family RNA polymerase sigma factor n=1 Tax=Dactylosporangium sp. AC04546 TaxID=2862460 RepID=UPI001EDEFC3A|nr:SigE family RNA polymerase sigma factor [Dactylosporangium sp. AC04546]WVK87139.1 SigE family RNA polymerase sigma factor [Dactylosporangium sp. AC04546]